MKRIPKRKPYIYREKDLGKFIIVTVYKNGAHGVYYDYSKPSVAGLLPILYKTEDKANTDKKTILEPDSFVIRLSDYLCEEQRVIYRLKGETPVSLYLVKHLKDAGKINYTGPLS